MFTTPQIIDDYVNHISFEKSSVKLLATINMFNFPAIRNFLPFKCKIH